MCGIAGKVRTNSSAPPVSLATIRRMTDAILYRGPDDDGFYSDPNVGLGQRRLSIIDLSTGKQPIFNEDETICVVFNGEIYNYKDLRKWLEDKGHRFRTNSDTEVIVHMYEEIGDDCVSRFYGMFAFALWDRTKQKLLMARDRVGIKPLYYYVSQNAILFASEVKAILATGELTASVDSSAVASFLTYFYCPGESTIFKGVKKLLPGYYMVVEKGGVSTRQYWDLKFPTQTQRRAESEIIEELDSLLAEVVTGHMISDVPVGVLLSGGVDSTAMLGYATEVSDRPLNTFTIGFDQTDVVDERPYARLAAKTFSSNHHELSISGKDFFEFLPKYVWHMEEPVCEPPAVSLYFVSKLAKQHVTVLLSGEGGDEAFAGYQNYRTNLWIERTKSVLGGLAPIAGNVLGSLASPLKLQRIQRYVPTFGSRPEDYYFSRTSSPWEGFNRVAGELFTPDFAAMVRSADPLGTVRALFGNIKDGGHLNPFLYVDSKTWLPDDLLIKADKITMANSLELRVPLLDHRVLEFAASLPVEMKVHGLTTKYALKKALEKRVPKPILNRKKTGFATPYGKWLRSDCRDLAWSVLTDPRTSSRGYFQEAAVEKMLRANEDGQNFSKEIFSLLTLELWHRTFVDGTSAPLPEASHSQAFA